jgi:hypothetical protein
MKMTHILFQFLLRATFQAVKKVLDRLLSARPAQMSNKNARLVVKRRSHARKRSVKTRARSPAVKSQHKFSKPAHI